MTDSQAVLGHLEAVEDLLKHGHTPTRTVYLAFGHDEEVGGEDGARAIAAELESRGVTLEFLLDEGANLGGCIRASRRIHPCISADSFVYLGEFIRVSRRVHQAVKPSGREMITPSSHQAVITPSSRHHPIKPSSRHPAQVCSSSTAWCPPT